ncbi:aspartate/glutamate racemase family protein [Inquilinus sp. NPDC058860]|uniref:aspartate/glutamate racemase family protein n=1 Tax=Inquilinus sp. NPDC058860 TaxID=3346652 RepID=UPI0036C4BC15
MPAHPRIALIHATPVAVDPIRDALAAGWPEARPVNILDDSLTPDRAEAEEISPTLTERIVELASYARRIGSDGVLFTCSAFGSAIETAASLLDVPVLKPNEAMFEAAIGKGQNAAMIVTFPPARASMEAEFAEEAQRLGANATLTSIVAEAAMTALRAGDADTHNRLVAEAACGLVGFDTIVLAHFSTARAADAVRRVIDIPVLTSPDAAVAKLRRLITGS